jgi:AhpD family alkylhydroperoxidase
MPGNQIMSGLDVSDFSYLPKLQENAKTEFEAFDVFHSAAQRSDGLIPSKYRELIALAVALTTQCPLCIENHTVRAKQAGASKEEISETVFVGAAVRAGGTVAHGLLALRSFEKGQALT